MVQLHNAAWDSAYAQDGILAKDMRLLGRSRKKLDAGLMLHAGIFCINWVHWAWVSRSCFLLDCLTCAALASGCFPSSMILAAFTFASVAFAAGIAGCIRYYHQQLLQWHCRRCWLLLLLQCTRCFGKRFCDWCSRCCGGLKLLGSGCRWELE